MRQKRNERSIAENSYIKYIIIIIIECVQTHLTQALTEALLPLMTIGHGHKLAITVIFSACWVILLFA